MFLFLLDQFVTAVETIVTAAERAVTESTDAYGVAAVALAVTGATVESAYQAMPEMNPRTVRRVLAGAGDAVRMCMSSSVQKEQELKDTIENADLESIRAMAEKAKVAPGVAESAVTRYGNNPERVRRVLADLGTLVAENYRVWSPTGLFTRLMRSGQEVKLPERVVQARRQVEQQKAERERVERVPEVGALVKLYGEVCRIVGLTRQFAEVETRDGLVNVARDALRFVAPG